MYNFDLEPKRRNTNSLKWNVKESELPMWVADMDFKTAPEITNEFIKRLESGIYGYNDIPDSFYDAYINWWEKYHNFKMEKDWIFFSTGVVPTISSAVRRLTSVGDNVLILTPVYNIFYNSILNNKRHVLECPLVYDNGSYEINFLDLEEKLKEEKTTLLIFCNPHNPVGKIWNKDELIKVGNLCKKYNVNVISDEIHCDIVRPGLEYIPFASVSDTNLDITVTCIAPTKCFNLAGIQTSAVVIKNKELKRIVERGLNTDECAEGNTLAVITPEVAFKCRDWLNEMNEYVFNNRKIVEDYIGKNIEELKVIKADATYLIWIDCNKITKDDKALANFIREETGLYVSSGSAYGKSGEGFIRMNVATTKKIVLDGLERFKKGINLFKEKSE